MEAFLDHFGEVPDPRAANARHDFLEVMFIALVGVLCGAEDCTDMALFGRAKLDLLRQVLKLEHGAPSHDTFSGVMRRCVSQFAGCQHYRPCRRADDGLELPVRAGGIAMELSATLPGVSVKATSLPRSSARHWMLQVRPARAADRFLILLLFEPAAERRAFT